MCWFDSCPAIHKEKKVIVAMVLRHQWGVGSIPLPFSAFSVKCSTQVLQRQLLKPIASVGCIVKCSLNANKCFLNGRANARAAISYELNVLNQVRFVSVSTCHCVDFKAVCPLIVRDTILGLGDAGLRLAEQ